jgi:hypothetical protein
MKKESARKNGKVADDGGQHRLPALQRKFRKNNVEGWTAALGAIFGRKIPENHSWTDHAKICWVLSQLGAPNLSRVLLPTGGKTDLTLAQPAGETGCIELILGQEGLTREGRLVAKDCVAIVSPSRLEFRAADRLVMAYFRLELEPLRLSRPNSRSEGGLYDCREEVIEVAPGRYKPVTAWESASQEAGWRRVERYLGKGAFTVFAWTSPFFTHVERLGDPKIAALSDSSDFARVVRRIVKANC